MRGSASARKKKRAAAHAALASRVNVLREAGYLDSDGLMPRGQLAQRINGYEIQATELMFAGVRDTVNIHRLAAAFTAWSHRERSRADPKPFRREPGPLMQAANQAVQRFRTVEMQQGIANPIKEPDWGISGAVETWSRGGTVEDLERLASRDAGDVVRTLRMAIQMMRQVAQQAGKGESLAARLEEAIVSINRDVVDAKRQFELG
ncbi:MAG: hypothetical protein AB8H80_14935 [Planctomycetota bacterium]